MPTKITKLMENKRTVTPGPENELTEALLSVTLPTDKKLKKVVFREPRLETGFPDVVAVYPKKSDIVFDDTRKNLTDRHIRVVHHLYQSRGRNISSLAQDLSIKTRTLERLIDELIEADMAFLRGNFICARSLSHIFFIKRIVAIESKIWNWKRALEQARGNLWFASHSYVAFPKGRSFSFLKEAKKSGVGVLAVDKNKINVLVEACPAKIPSSYASWLFNEWVLSSIKKG